MSDVVRLAAIALLSLLFVLDDSAIPAAQQPSSATSYQKVAAPFFKQYCIDCHGPDVQEGKLRLDTLNTDVAAGPDAVRWQLIRTRLLWGEMPPDDAPQPKPQENEQIVQWLGEQMISAARLPRYRSPPAPPSEGNRVDHDLLFGPHTNDIISASPAREWRISPQIYFQLLKDLDPHVLSKLDRPDYEYAAAVRKLRVRHSQPFSAGGGGGFQDYSGTFTVDKSTAGVLIRNAKQLAKDQTAWRTDGDGKPQFDRRTKLLRPAHDAGIPDEFLVLMDLNTEPIPELLQAAIRKQFQLVVLREPTEDELDRFLALAQQNIQDAGQMEGVRGTLAAVLLLREVIFRSELGAGPADEYGRRMLVPRELAFAISYALTDHRPDAELLEALSPLAGEGTSPDEVKRIVRQQVERMLNDPKIEKHRLPRFFQEFFGYPEAIGAFKDNQTKREYTDALQLPKGTYFNFRPESLVRDTDMLVEHIIAQDKNVFQQMLTTNKAFINYDPRQKRQFKRNHNEKYQAIFYNLQNWPQKQPIRLSDDQRAGILTQPSWLVHFAFNDRTDPIHRGKWIRERLLGAHLPAVPSSVDATIPDLPDQTVRERLAKTRKAYCWSCHRKMNPLGLSLEMYDAFGRVRSEELGRPVDSTGSIDFSGEEELDGPVQHGIEMIKKLAQSERVRQVMVRHAFRYWIGRAETINDAPALVAADRAYVKRGGSLKALITSLLTSDTFLYRVPLENNSLAAKE